MQHHRIVPSIALVSRAAAALWVIGCRAPDKPAAKVYEVGFLSTSATPSTIQALKDGLREQGYVEGQTINVDWRVARNRDELPAIASEFVGRKVDLIIAGGTEAVQAAMQKTKAIPIVMTNSGDPVGAGLVASLAKPGGNVTGLTQISPVLTAKRVELLKEAVPELSRLGVLWYPDHPTTRRTFAEVEAAAPQLGLRLQSLEVRETSALPRAFRAASQARAGALMVLRDPFMVRHRQRVAQLALEHRLPAMYESRDFVDAGGLLLYGPRLEDLYRRAALHAHKVLQGANPAELPVEQPATFELVINQKTADAMRLTLPEALVLRATEVVR
ncbi:MAG: ABC transporter substrate-binding protein [Gemmatimonadaceae bacterium]